ncbi:MAG: TolC family protein [Tepidisphaeraceae bacterium]
MRTVLQTGTRPPTLPRDGTLGLSDAFALANVGSETIAIEGEAYIRSVVQKRRAVSAFLPAVDLNPSYGVRNGGSATGGNGSSSGGSNSSGKYDANLDIPIDLDLVVFDGMQNVNSYWRDVYLVERQRQLLLEAQEQLLSDVAQTYYAVLRSEAQVRVLENSLKVQEERLRTTRGQQQAGTGRPLDVAQTQAQVSATRVQLIEAQRAVQDGRSLLEYLLNAPVRDAKLTDGLSVASEKDLAIALKVASTHRSELAASERAVAAAQRDVKVALGEYYPSVSIGLSAWLYRETAPDSRTWEGLLNVSLPIFSGGRIEADVRTAWSFLREAILVDAQTRRHIHREIEQSQKDINASEARLAELAVQLSAARDAYKQADASYAAGLGTNLERVVAQDAQLQAELAFVTEQINLKLFRIALLRATGTLREELLDAKATTRPASRPTPGSTRSESDSTTQPVSAVIRR